ncbi:uncharacterized protein LOC131859272 [Cryptomeria japonica]|uniref:uncharacterized protein LOC131859272 n=1 Tax=Cryptomeria japonica TaxID=3369 RepID=UPI0027DA4AAC|nr:uncharacterized protein LOC131859272 [Cryptomeria japonica]
MYFDGLRCQTGSRAGVVFVSLEGKPIPLSFHLEFHCTNNIIEYKALIASLCATIAMGVKNLRIHGDLELIINQVTGAYRVKQLKLSRYKDLVLTILKKFITYMIDNITQRENCHADAMASVASLVGPVSGHDEYCFMVQVLRSLVVSDQTQFDDLMCSHVDSREWFVHIFNYLKIKSFPDDAGKSSCV